MPRHDGRTPDALRPIRITPHFLNHPPGSCLVEFGRTRVLCSAMLQDSVPPFLKGSGRGWLTAEYSMLPGSSAERIQRERTKLGGRTQEIQRLIGRSLRTCVNMQALGERSVLVDCDVLDADGGTRTAAITGAYVAVGLALQKCSDAHPELRTALQSAVAAVSVGVVDGTPVLDLDYTEDKAAEVDMNIVMNDRGQFIEIQGTAEAAPFGNDALHSLLALAHGGIGQLLKHQTQVLQA